MLIHARGDRFITVEHAHCLAAANGCSIWVSDCNEHVGTFAAEPVENIARVARFI